QNNEDSLLFRSAASYMNMSASASARGTMTVDQHIVHNDEDLLSASDPVIKASDGTKMLTVFLRDDLEKLGASFPPLRQHN
ncbi:unnamed protein product, partial [Amoebophrya sp. A25]